MASTTIETRTHIISIREGVITTTEKVRGKQVIVNLNQATPAFFKPVPAPRRKKTKKLIIKPKTGEECPICYDALTPEDFCQTKCKHQFHLSCLLRSYSSNKTCPLCRTKLTL